MSRIGRQPIEIPSGVKVSIDGRVVKVTGPKGELSLTAHPGLKVATSDNQVVVTKTRNNPDTTKAYGLLRTLVANMVTGVATGYSRSLEINGVGYRASVSGQTLNLSLGFSHPVTYQIPVGVEAKVEKNIVTLSGANKQQVGQVAAEIRSFKKPEPYKGKGLKYVDERIRRKAGKTATKA